MNIKLEIEKKGMEMDKEWDGMVEAVSPEGKYSVRALGELVSAINLILPSFDKSIPLLTPPQSDIEGALPLEITKAVAMISEAVKESDLGLEGPNLDSLQDDSSLIMAAGIITNLANSPEFKMFLKMPKEKEDSVGDKEEDLKEGEVEASPSDDMFMERM